MIYLPLLKNNSIPGDDVMHQTNPIKMVTMISDKTSGPKTDAITTSSVVFPSPPKEPEAPNALVYKKMEAIIDKMQNETTGVPVRTVKSFLSKIPSVFTGQDLILWMTNNLDLESQAEALHIAHLMASHGYLFPIEEHALSVKNDNTFYRFQTPYYWPSNCWEPENTDYAVYLCKRTMQNKTRLELADYEAENLALLQKLFSRKWEFIFMQAEAQCKVDKKRDKLERKVLDSQERAFWDVHRPMPGCVNTTEVDMKKLHSKKNKSSNMKSLKRDVSATCVSHLESIKKEITLLKLRLDRRNIKLSKVAETYINYYEQYLEYDPYFTPTELANPWHTDNTEFWDEEKQAKEISARRVRRWAFSLQELLKDPLGRDHFTKFLEKEFSGENLKFWEAVQELKCLPLSEVPLKAEEIWSEFLAVDASCPINVDSRSHELTRKNIETPSRWAFDTAAAHVYHLMKSDSYSRYLRSDIYRDFLNGSKKKSSMKGIRSIVSFSSARKDTSGTA
uniref:Regulator of G-protein signaling 7 n=2 Tax=Cacopsylla melanoneura TaxID=428564 RepID=A0A8D8U5U1_9HEMI